MSSLAQLIGRLRCWFGYHDFRVIDKTFGFGEAGGVEKVECQRCGGVMTRPG
jgi:hypothetical protein